ncbi:MAG TPA: RuBisCO accumulation factor 1, partial [Candidatus Caenarcaniphilales bacterium]
WQVVLKAEDPVAILGDTDRLPTSLPGKPEEVLVVVDRAQREWEAGSYFVVEPAGQLEFQWFEEAPDLPLLGRVLLVMRPKKILDEDVTKDLWQIDE